MDKRKRLVAIDRKEYENLKAIVNHFNILVMITIVNSAIITGLAAIVYMLCRQ